MRTKLAGTALLALVSTAAYGQVATEIKQAPALTTQRHNEDWSYLSDPSRKTGRWIEKFKYIPLDETMNFYLTTGMEYRANFEGYEDVGWGSAPDDSYVWHRFMPYADLHAGSMRVFAQPILSSVSGLERPARPIDTTGSDMLQAFVEAEADVADDIELKMSAGRKLVSLGAGRFIDTRYGPNVPQAFDGFDASLTDTTRQLTALYFRPVVNKPGDFDDTASREKAVWGAYATQWLTDDKATGFDVYYLGLLDRNSVVDQGSGRGTVHTFGTRSFGDTRDWFWNLDAAVQVGKFAGHDVLAWGAGGEVGHRFLHAAMQPEIKFAADVISGDSDPNDPELGTFNPLFPRGKYFGALSPIGPRNLIHLRPSISIHPHEDVTVSLTGAAYWRQSTADGIYAISGNIVRPGKASKARYVGRSVELAVSWQVIPELNVTTTLSAFDAGRFIEETGAAKTIKMLGVAANYRF